MFVNDYRSVKVKADCSVLVTRPQPEDQGFYERMQFRVGPDPMIGSFGLPG